MATTRITPTRYGAGPKGLDYATKQDKPHHDDLPSINKRVLKLTAYNCSVNDFKKNMEAIWTANRTQQKKQIELYRITQSFSHAELNPDSEEDKAKCNAIGVATAKKLYPGRLFVVATQADGRGHMLHNHIEVCSLHPKTGKALRGIDTQQGHIAEVSDSVCKQFGLSKPEKLPEIKPNQRNTRSGIKYNVIDKQNDKRGQNGSFFEQIQRKLILLLLRERVYNFEKFVEEGKKEGLDIHVRRNKKGKINGLSYKLDDGSHKRAVRAKKLGTKFQADSIQEMLDKNLKRYRLIQRNQQLARENAVKSKPAKSNQAKSKERNHEDELER